MLVTVFFEHVPIRVFVIDGVKVRTKVSTTSHNIALLKFAACRDWRSFIDSNLVADWPYAIILMTTSTGLIARIRGYR